jgi:hypothetical protein
MPLITFLLLKMFLHAFSDEFQWLYTDGRLNISKYMKFLQEFEEPLRTGDKLRNTLQSRLWYRTQHKHLSEFYKRNVYKLILSSSYAHNCPEPNKGVSLWEPPESSVNSHRCIKVLEHKRKVLLEAAKSTKQRYPPIRGFFHVTLNANSYYNRNRSKNDTIFETQLQVLNKSGLLEHSSLVLQIGLRNGHLNHTRTRCTKVLIESRVQEFAKGAQVKYVNPYDYECGTIQSFRSWCSKNPSSFVFYLHNKGVTYFEHPEVFLNVEHWREFMMFFLFERWQLCANSLVNGAKTCGVKKETIPVQHYSGNFWWASCDHISRVTNPCPPGQLFRHAAEFWLISDVMLLSGADAALELWHGGPTYYKPYPRERYICADLVIQNRTLF